MIKGGEVVLQREFPQPVDRVWRAITDSEVIAKWLMPNTFMPTVGHEFTFQTKPAPGFDGVVQCRVIAVEPEKSLSYTWKGGGIDTVVEWSLTPTEKGTLLQLRHHGFKGIRGSLIKRILGNGWKSLLTGDSFAKLLEELK